MTLSGTFKRWFDGLQSREQRILRLGAPVIGVILIFGSLGWLADARQAASERSQRAAVLEPRIALLLSGASPAASSSSRLGQARTEGDLTILRITDAPFDEVLEQIAEWESKGGRIQAIQLSRTADGRVSGEIRGSLAQR